MSEHPEATPPRLHQRFRGLIAAVILLTLILVLRVLAPWAVVWPEALILPLKDWIGAAMDWLIHNLSFGLYTFQELSRDTTIGPVSWVGAIFGAMILMHKLGGWRLAGLTLFCFGYMAAFGLWQSSMKTLSSILIAVPFGCFAGLMLGILAHRSRRMERAVVVLLDFMQTVPGFAYLLPVLFLLGFSPVSAMLATMIYAMPAMARATILGLQTVPEEVIEFGTITGTTRRQML